MTTRTCRRLAAALLIISTTLLHHAEAVASPPRTPSPAGDPSASQSTVAVDPLFGLVADGVDEVTITVTVVDSQGAPLADETVRVASSDPADMIAQPVAPTDADGRAVATLATWSAGGKTLVATVDPEGDSIELNQQPTVVFSEPLVQPNIVVILLDDVGTDALSMFDEVNPYQADLPYVHGQEGAGDVPGNGPGTSNLYVNSPSLQQLADDGVTFLNAYAMPVCSPTRAALLTGNYPIRTGVGHIMFREYLGGTMNEFGDPGFEFPTLADLAHSASYDDLIVGKWHLGMPSLEMDPQDGSDDYLNWSTIPLRGGFTNWICTLRGLDNPPEPPDGGTYYNFYMSRNQVDHADVVAAGPDTEFATVVQFDEALTWCNSRSKPFVCIVEPNAAHSPWGLLPPQNLLWTEEYVEGPLNAWSGQLASIEALDSKIGDLVNGLDPAKRAVTTFFVIGDNGTPKPVLAQARQNGTIGGVTGSDKNLGETYDLLLDSSNNRFKGSAYEKGARVPMIVSGYGVSNPGRYSYALADVTDVFPTVAEMLSVDFEGDLHGYSLVPILEDTVDYQSHVRDFTYAEDFWPLGSTGPDVEFTSRQISCSLRIPAQGRYKIVWDQDWQTDSFYKLQDANGNFVDPFETVDLPHGPGDAEHANYLLVLQKMQEVIASGDDTGPQGCPGAVNFCSALPNTLGEPAYISYTGSCSIVTKDFTLVAQPVPNEFGIFYYGQNQVNGGDGVPYGDGLRCVGGDGSQVFRLPITMAVNNVLEFQVNFQDLPSGGEILPGSTWNFQGWYRDPLSPSTFNLTDGLTATFSL